MQSYKIIEDYYRAEPDPEVIILTASGGTGHLVAAEQEKKKYGKKAVVINIIEKDWLNLQGLVKQYGFGFLCQFPFFKNLFLRNFGKEGVAAWDLAQKTGDLATLENLIKQQPLAKTIFGPNISDEMSKLLIKYPKTKLVITTQPLGIAEIHAAITDHNLNKLSSEEKTKLKIVMTDLPTEHAVHFFNSIKEINMNYLAATPVELDIPYIALPLRIPSLTDYHEALMKLCPEIYFPNSCHPKDNITIQFTHGPIDDEFKGLIALRKEKGNEQVKKQFKETPVTLKFSQKAYDLIYRIESIQNQFLLNTQVENNLLFKQFQLLPNARISTLMLGSQASLQTIDVVHFEYQLHQLLTPDQPHFLFVFCGDDVSEKSLFLAVNQLAEKYNKNDQFIIVPLPHQNRKTIKHLYCVADTSIIRAGGMSVMELIAASSGNVVIFAELDKNLTNELLMKYPERTLVVWEKGNAKHIIIQFGSHRVIVVNVLNYLSDRKKQIVNTLNLSSHKETPSFKDPLVQSAYQYAVGLILQGRALLPLDHYGVESLYPYSWAVRFAYFIKDHVSNKQSNDLNLLYQLAEAYANAFYEPSLGIVSHEEAVIYAHAYQEFLQNTKDAASVRRQAMNRVVEKRNKNIENDFKCDDVLQIKTYPLSYKSLWDKAASLQEKIIVLFSDYNEYAFLHPRRKEQKKAEELINEIKLNNYSDKELLNLLCEHRDKNLKITDPQGSFMRRLNFAIKMVDETINTIKEKEQYSTALY